MGDQNRQQPAPQVPARTKNRGPRSLWIDRWKNGFGFTLRHFVVYPPESYMVMAKEKRLGLRHGSTNLNEPMDTIFVKAVHEGTSAHAAGLETGDRVLSVNGETIAGKTYAQVVQQIHNTPERLNLLVVPKEEDIIQQYYSDTAHNPKTNARPRLRSPEVVQGHKRASALSLPATALRQQPQQTTPPFISPPHGLHSSDTESLYNQLVWADSKIGSENRGTMEMHRLKTLNSRWLNDGNGKKVQTDQISVIKTMPGPPTLYPNASGCRLSLDGGILDRRESSSSSTLTDDSVIMSRIRKSCEQKEEFLRNTVTPMYSQIIAKEFYARPQKLQKPVWPPNSPEIDGSEVKSSSALSGDERTTQRTGKQVPGKPLTNIQENPSQNFASGTFDSDAGDVSLSWHDSPVSRSHSEESDSVRLGVSQPKLHIVSRRAMQFETGQLEEEDRTPFFKGELSRLSGKRAVPNVAVRKQEFERVGREERQSLGRDSRSFDSCSPTRDNGYVSGNRTVIVGSKQIHVEPPTDFRQLSPERDAQSQSKPRVRSNSAESWSSRDGNHSTKRSMYGASIDRAKDEDKQRHKAVRQDSYLAAVKPVSSNTARLRRIIRRKSFNHDSDESSDEDFANPKQAVHKKEIKRPNRLSLQSPEEYIDGGTQVPDSPVPINQTTEVVRRQKNTSSLKGDDDRSTRRISYLKATSSDQMNIDLDKEPNTTNLKSNKKWMYPMLPGDIQRLRRIFEEYSGIIDSGGEPPPRRHLIDSPKPEAKENFKIIKDGWLNCKVALIDGKRAGDRSWKTIWGILRGPFFSMHKDKQIEQAEHTVDIRSCAVDIPQDYTKKKNVFRLRTETDTEYLLQAEDQGDMEQWTKILNEQSESSNTLSPVHKGIKKLSSLRTRSPTGQSPASKTRKPSQQEQSPSPKSKTWKGKLGKQFRKMQQSGAPPSSPTAAYVEGATIKVPIDLCPPSTISEYIPLIVERCTTIVETRGLEIVGIYRVPGNTAAVAALTEAVNKGIELISPEDPRWNDVNVISSLLKSFFRNLPDSLFTSELYPKFIEADKIIDPKLRMVTLRKLIKELPEHNFETLKHLLYHLKKIVSKSSVNKMETRNLAIVFGPTLLTTGDLMSLVTDTSHQCRIVESLISHVDWFFSNDDVDQLENLTLPMSSDSQLSETPTNANLLLGNIHKIEGYPRLDHSPNKDMSPKDIVSSIISAANRKISKGKSKKTEKPVTSFDSETKSGMKKRESKEEIEPSTSVAASIVSSFVGEIVRNSSGDLNRVSAPSLGHDEVIRSYSGLDATTLERIRRFEQETQAMLQREPVRMRRDTERWLADKQVIEKKLQQAKRELETEDILDALADNPSDLTKKSSMAQFSSQVEDINAMRRGTSYESLHETTPNGSLKRFKSSKEDSGLRTAASLDSLHERTKSELSDDGNDLVLSLTKTFDKKLRSVLSESDSSSLGDDNKSTTEKADYESVIEKTSKLYTPTYEKKPESDNDEKAKEEELKKSKVKMDPKMKEKMKKFEISETILRTKNTENACNLKRSESLNKPEKPDIITKLKRSESLNKNEKENDFTKLKRSDSSKNDLKRSDSLTKYEKTETNLNKRKQQESGLKRSSSKEKENVMLIKLKRKNGMPDRSIKRRHTVGGTKDFDKLPWLDNSLQSEDMENEKSLRGKEKRNLRTSSPDLSSSRLKATIESEGLSIEVSLLGSRGNVLATLRKSLIAPAPSGRPQSMPPVSQIFKLPLESHV